MDNGSLNIDVTSDGNIRLDSDGPADGTYNGSLDFDGPADGKLEGSLGLDGTEDDIDNGSLDLDGIEEGKIDGSLDSDGPADGTDGGSLNIKHGIDNGSLDLQMMASTTAHSTRMTSAKARSTACWIRRVQLMEQTMAHLT
jgi:hypothetical protein